MLSVAIFQRRNPRQTHACPHACPWATREGRECEGHGAVDTGKRLVQLPDAGSPPRSSPPASNTTDEPRRVATARNHLRVHLAQGRLLTPRKARRCRPHASILPVTLPAPRALFFVSSPHVLHAPRGAPWAHDLSIRGDANYRTPAVHRAGPPPRTDRNSGCWYSKKIKIRVIHKAFSTVKNHKGAFRKTPPDQRIFSFQRCPDLCESEHLYRRKGFRCLEMTRATMGTSAPSSSAAPKNPPPCLAPRPSHAA